MVTTALHWFQFPRARVSATHGSFLSHINVLGAAAGLSLGEGTFSGLSPLFTPCRVPSIVSLTPFIACGRSRGGSLDEGPRAVPSRWPAGQPPPCPAHSVAIPIDPRGQNGEHMPALRRRTHPACLALSKPRHGAELERGPWWASQRQLPQWLHTHAGRQDGMGQYLVDYGAPHLPVPPEPPKGCQAPRGPAN